MNLNYTLKTLAEIINGRIVGDEDFVIQNIIIDSRVPIIQNNSLFIALKGNKTDGHKFCNNFVLKGGKALLVTSAQKGNNIHQIIVEDTLFALQQIAKYHRSQFNIPVIGIAGSNGKTTVKEWLFHTLKDDFFICRSPKSYNSRLGVSLSVLELNKSHSLGIFETGISKPNEMKTLADMIQPTIGVFTGIGDAHQTNFESIEQKKEEKYKLFNSVEKIIELDNNVLDLDIPYSDLASQLNANLVYKCGNYLDINDSLLLLKLKTLPTISMRLEKMEGKNDNIIINDAYSLDDKSLEIGIKFLNAQSKTNKRLVIIGPHEVISDKATKLLSSVDEVIVIGNNSYSSCNHYYKTANDFTQAQLSFSNTTILVTGTRSTQLEKIISSLIVRKHITKLKINLASVRNNLNYFRSKLSANTMVLAMVKARSYGGGIVKMAQFLESEKVNYFGVAYADEGVTLRRSGITTPIIVMNPEQEAFDDIINYNLEPSIYSLSIVDQFISTLIRQDIKSYPIHLKIDTGMNRLGFQKDNINELISQLKAQPEVYVKSVFSHLSVADDITEKDFTINQINILKSLSNQIQNQLGYSFFNHIANSEATLNYPESHLNMVRLGIGIYGLMPNFKNKLKQVLSFQTQVSQIKKIKKGDFVGYGRVFKAKKAMTIAIIPVGYADGLKRCLSTTGWQILVNNTLVPIIGNICMDMTMIDISNINCRVADEVIIFDDKENSVFEMSNKLNTIPYEIISSISDRVRRVYSD